jgi:ribosomal RNA-processing protein 9
MVRSRRGTSQQKSPSKGGRSGPSKRPRATLDLGWSAAADRSRDVEAKHDHHVDSDSDDDDVSLKTPSEDEEDDRHETLEEKKVRLAREYLDRIDAKGSDDGTDESSASSSEDDEENDNDHDRVSRKLRRERQKVEGSYERFVADKVGRHVQSLADKVAVRTTQASEATIGDWKASGFVHAMRGHDLTPTCVALVGGDKAISGSKDHSVILWDLTTHTKVASICDKWKKSDTTAERNGGQVLSVACSSDGRFAAVGRRDASVQIFDVRSKSNCELLKTFVGHKGPVSCLAFRHQSHQLFSGSSDRCIRHYDLDESIYLETLYGHQFGVTGIDCHRKERPVSVGEDRTARAWKLSEDSHLIFRGGAKVQFAECVSAINDDWFLTGHQGGLLSLWFAEKKRAVSFVEQAHGADEGGAGTLDRSVVSVTSLRMGDIAATGSYDGFLRLWKVQTGRTTDSRGLEALGKIPLHGYINSIAFGPKANFCVAAIGEEHRLGRWNRIKKAQNRIAVVKLCDEDLTEHAVALDGDERSTSSPEDAESFSNDSESDS